jgi:hypothetical protein
MTGNELQFVDIEGIESSTIVGAAVDNVVGVSAEHNVGGGVVGSLGRVRAGFTAPERLTTRGRGRANAGNTSMGLTKPATLQLLQNGPR